jgi:hypothetical protein
MSCGSHQLSKIQIPSGMTSTIFPISLYEELLPKVVAVLELTQQTEGLTSQQAKQKLLQTVG